MAKTIFKEPLTDGMCQGCMMKNDDFFKEGKIFISKYFSTCQDTEIAYPGLIVIAPLLHKEKYEELDENEITEFHKLVVKVKKELQTIFNCQKFCCVFNEKPKSHWHFLIIPLHGLVKIENKHTVIKEMIDKNHILLNDTENMAKVTSTIAILREKFK